MIGPKVRLSYGTIRGTTINNVHCFKGIPYAAPPVGDLRWRPPAPPIPWTGEREMTEFGRVGDAGQPRRDGRDDRHCRRSDRRELSHAERLDRPRHRRRESGDGVDSRRRQRRRFVGATALQRRVLRAARRHRAGHHQLPARRVRVSAFARTRALPATKHCSIRSRRCAGCAKRSASSAAIRKTSPCSARAPAAWTSRS